MNLFQSSCFAVVSILGFGGTLNLRADDVLLAGWSDFSSAHQAHKWLSGAKVAESDLDNVTGSLYGGDGARHTWGSTDGTYGPSQAVGNSVTDGSMSIRVDFSNVRFSISNGTKRNLYLGQIVFDFASVNGNSPQNLSIYYESGDLADADETLLVKWESILNGLGQISDYEDKELDLSVLGDQILEPGQEAVFRFQVDTANVNNQALGLDNIAILGGYADFSILTYNIHGGEGPSGEGDPSSNLTAFRDNFMNDEDIICLQEVDNGDCWTAVQTVFSDYPYRYRTINETTGLIWPWESQSQTSIAILSKIPFETTNNQLIQTDPGGDEWERHAQYVTVKVGENTVHIFHFHNTYNWGEDNGFWSEIEGLEKFRDDYVYDKLGISSLNQADRLVMLGDFNLLYADVSSILPSTSHEYNGRDHVCSMPVHSQAGRYTTVSADLSDHPAIWATMDVQAPAPDPMTWATPPVASGVAGVHMEATPAADPYGVEYYFTNTTVTDGSHDSGWQSSPVYTDSGLDDDVTYAYTVKARDRSANVNETSASASASATVDIDYLSLPYTESFEDGTAGDWSQTSDDDYDWTVHTGGTATSAAGPNGASDGSFYFYAEGHHGAGSYATSSVVAHFDFSGVSSPLFQFDYHMYGAYIDYLALDVHDGTTWTEEVWFKDGQQHSNSAAAWSTAVVDLSAYAGKSKVKLRFRTANTLWNAADPAIDNLILDEAIAFSYSQWASSALAGISSEEDSAPTADPDLDGRDNEMEWLLNTNPSEVDSAFSSMTVDGGEVTLEFSRRKLEAVRIYAEWSPDLEESSWSAIDLIESVIEEDEESETVQVSLPVDQARKFVRIKVEKD
ncbi:MAG: endonuclease/exonuclease/phosphatase family protein [Verrucomicrobiales bacterium]